MIELPQAYASIGWPETGFEALSPWSGGGAGATRSTSCEQLTIGPHETHLGLWISVISVHETPG